ncbi:MULTISPECIES: hypothetical protein [unclassified Butyrivibrio]|uniref:hypothetical protein n=1 Tax=unclassified Butyrivibrio TaxID=2639466 RepID=UPI000478AF15|nr:MULTISPECIES: hypothetical protein [unclassified Butyrivibrio]
MGTKIYKERFKNKMLLILMALPAGLVTVSRTFIIRDISIKENFGTIFVVTVFAVLILLLACLLGIKRIIINTDYFVEKKIIGEKRFYYDRIETCFYDSVQDSICVINKGKSNKIKLENYDQSSEILSELQKHMSIEMI